jgi:hypothetical protein
MTPRAQILRSSPSAKLPAIANFTTPNHTAETTQGLTIWPTLQYESGLHGLYCNCWLFLSMLLPDLEDRWPSYFTLNN